MQTCFPLRLKIPKKLSFSNFDLTMLTIDDVTELEGVSLRNCSNVDMTLFRNAKNIKVEQRAEIDLVNAVKISDLISFRFLSHIMLTSCDIVDVILFKNVRSVELKCCRKLTSLQGLGSGKRNHEVTLSAIGIKCPGITDFSPLNGLHRVRIHNCVGINDGYQVKDVKHLEISCCGYVDSFHMFGNVRYLRIDSCPGLVTLFGLQDVPYLEIRGCLNLREIEGLKSNQYVEIQNCRSLNRERKYYKTFFSFLPHFSIT
jgi:hypothetical protein